MTLTAPSQGANPLHLDLPTDDVELPLTVVQPKVLIEAAQHRRELTLLIPPLPVPVPFEPFPGFGQELSAAFDAGNPHQSELATPVNSAYVCETQEVKLIRLLASLRQVGPNETPEPHQPRLFFSQLQTEFPEPIRQALCEPVGVAPILEVHHKVIRKPRQARLALAHPRGLLLEPEVKHIVQVDICQDRADHAMDAKDNFEFERLIPLRRSDSVLDLRHKK